MNLKNYTSSVAASTTIARIEGYLAECGVSGTTKEFNRGQPCALSFHVKLDGKPYTIRLPANIEAVQATLYNDYIASRVRPRDNVTKESFLEQATKTAWKLQQDWVQVQMSLIKLNQVDFRQAFLAYFWDGERTFYEQLQASKFKALPETTS
jgi:hypothetical protein